MRWPRASTSSGDRAGAGSKVKIINQLLAGVHIAAAAEAMALGLREGVDPAALYEVITHSAGNSWMFENRMAHVLAADYTPLSAVDIFVKDLGLVLDLARASKFPLPLSSTAHQMFMQASTRRLRERGRQRGDQDLPGHRVAEAMSLILGCIADDFTGGTDLANNLVRAGMRTVQVIGVPEGQVADCDAVVVALKSRTAPVGAGGRAVAGRGALAACAGCDADLLQGLLDLRLHAARQHRPGDRGADGRAGRELRRRSRRPFRRTRAPSSRATCSSAKRCCRTAR